MVFLGGGPTYTELCAMDMQEYSEAVQARVLWQEETKKQ